MAHTIGRLKHLIDWKFWGDEEVRDLLQLARKVKRHRWEYQGHMQGNTLVMIFQKTSTRTRVSFEAGMTELGGHAIHLEWAKSNFTLSKVGIETRYLSRNAALIMARLRRHEDLLDKLNLVDIVPANNFRRKWFGDSYNISCWRILAQS